jgi:hypothetical protein
VVIYGKTANRSEVARLMLQARGYEAHVMEGGTGAWVAQGAALHHPRRPARPRRLTLRLLGESGRSYLTPDV